VTSAEIMVLFQRLNTEQGITIVVVTHEEDIAGYARRRVMFRDGVIVSDERRSTHLQVDWSGPSRRG
jgi:putative ABC transport system ATP-binding protein